MIDKQVNINDTTIFYRAGGTGRCVVLIHGFGEDGDIWKNQVADLEKQYRVIVPDLPGSGRSGMYSDMSMEGMAFIIKYILQAEFEAPDGWQEPGKEIVIGHSMGGYIALAFAEIYGKELAGLGLVHSTAYADSEEKKATRRKGIEFIKEHGAFAFLETATPKLFSDKTKKERPFLVNELIASLRDFSGEALVAYYEVMIQRPDRTAVLKQANFPVLFIIGEEDTAIPSRDMLEQSHLPPVAAIHLLSDTGHMGMLEKSAETTDFLLEFLSLTDQQNLA